jgi:phosphoribosyl 1,2-cyclic phosphodiesterase
MGISFTLLGSGSSGNTTLISDGDTNILVDVGLSGRETAKRIRAHGLEPDKISAIVVSHEHGDHCRGVGPFAKELDIPVFMAEGAFLNSGIKLDAKKHRRISSGESFEVYGFVFTCFAVPHDSADPLGFVIEKDGIKIGIVLDLGFLSNLVVERLRGCDGIIMESNHDVRMP